MKAYILPVIASALVGAASPTPDPDWRAMREAVEQAARGQLIDPSSAQFSWPYGFTDEVWTPIVGRSAAGWVICGQVNARNRMGGYTGAMPIAAVVSKGAPQVILVEIADDLDARKIAQQCDRIAFPDAPPGMLPAPSSGEVGVADELEKLAALRDKGIITPAEFDAQKAKLLAR